MKRIALTMLFFAGCQGMSDPDSAYSPAIRSWCEKNLNDPRDLEIVEIGKAEKVERPDWTGELDELVDKKPRKKEYMTLVPAKIRSRVPAGGFRLQRIDFLFKDGKVLEALPH